VFPGSYCATSDWLERLSGAATAALDRASSQLEEAAAADPSFTSLASGVTLLGRTKSTFSTMKKLLRLERLGAGGRRRDQVYDLLGLRALVAPRGDLPPAEAEAAATAACYRLRVRTRGGGVAVTVVGTGARCGTAGWVVDACRLAGQVAC
jgi:hypothetical protein